MCCFVVESSRLGTPERCDVLLFRELVLNEGVEEFVVEGLVPGLAGEHCAEVRAAPCPVSFDAGDRQGAARSSSRTVPCQLVHECLRLMAQSTAKCVQLT